MRRSALFASSSACLRGPRSGGGLVLRALVALAACGFFAPGLWAITGTEMDDFEDGTTEAWTQPNASGNVVNVATGGNDGVDDNFLQVTATGTAGPGSRAVVVNTAQWTGDYTAVGTEFTISAWFANFGATDLSMRLGIEGDGLTGMSEIRFVSSTGFALPADGVWRQATFTLSAAEMTSVGDPLSLGEALETAVQARFLSATSATWQGEQSAAVFGIDDIEVVSVPVELQSFSVD